MGLFREIWRRRSPHRARHWRRPRNTGECAAMLTPGLRSASPRSIQATNRAACMGLFRASFSVPTSRPPP